MDVAPVSPISLKDRSNSMREELNESAWPIDAAPVSPNPLEVKFNVVRIELDVSACARAAAPVGPILLSNKFNIVRVGSLLAMRRRSSEKEESKLCSVIICSRVEFDSEY